MKTLTKTKITLAILLAVSSNVTLATKAQTAGEKDDNTEQSIIENSVVTKYSPEVTLDTVQEIFGHNLETQDTTLKTLLLAIGMDHTTNTSPNAESNIGIPFIVDKGPKYWVARLVNKDYEVEVLVNNALLLLFSKEEFPNAQQAADDLMLTASAKGYWPASYYIAERNLNKFLTRDLTKKISSAGAITTEKLKTIADDTMKRYNECAELGFAPCQYRIGFWLANSEKTVKDGLEVLRRAIKTTMSDKRYFGALDGAIISAAKEIVFKGEEAGLEHVVREEYTKLIQHQLSALTQAAAQATEIQND